MTYSIYSWETYGGKWKKSFIYVLLWSLGREGPWQFEFLRNLEGGRLFYRKQTKGKRNSL